LLQDRLTKGPIYAKNGVPQYVLVNLRDRCVENHTAPSAPRRRYLERTILAAGEQLRLVAFPDVSIAVDDLPSPRPRRSRKHPLAARDAARSRDRADPERRLDHARHAGRCTEPRLRNACARANGSFALGTLPTRRANRRG